MAIYKYSCPKCGTEVERIQKYGEEAPVCPKNVEDGECGGNQGEEDEVRLERKIGRPNAHFEGDGFHVNDYDSNNPAS